MYFDPAHANGFRSDLIQLELVLISCYNAFNQTSCTWPTIGKMAYVYGKSVNEEEHETSDTCITAGMESLCLNLG